MNKKITITLFGLLGATQLTHLNADGAGWVAGGLGLGLGTALVLSNARRPYYEEKVVYVKPNTKGTKNLKQKIQDLEQENRRLKRKLS